MKRLLLEVLVVTLVVIAAAAMVSGVLNALVSLADARVKAGPNVVSAHHRLRTPAPFDGGIVSAPASAAYSFRRLRQAYTGPAVQLRRASDNAVLDIGFTAGGDFDTAAAATHCNATSCFLAKWYDQSGNARDAVQATAGNQPGYVADCGNGKPCAVSTPATQVLAGPSVTPAGSQSFAVVGKTASAADCNFLKAGVNYISENAGNPWWLLWNGGTPVIASGIAHGAWHAGAGGLDIAAAAADLLVDGTFDSGNQGVAPSLTAGPIQVSAGSGTGTVACSTGEAIWWTGYLLTATERANLNANQKGYWAPAPLDTFATPAAAYSLRKLKSSYAGPAIRLRRASDNAEQDINFLGFVPGSGAPLDVAAANVFCASTSCFVKTWYDQSGNTRDAVQATAANQPAYMTNCVGSLPCLRVSTAGQILQTGSLSWAAAKTSLSIVAVRSAGTGVCYLAGKSSNTLYPSGANNWQLNDFVSSSIFAVAGDGAAHAGIGVIDGAASVVRIDGAETTGTVTGAATAGTLAVARLDAATATCNQTEAIIWDNYALTATERAALTANQRAYWGF